MRKPPPTPPWGRVCDGAFRMSIFLLYSSIALINGAIFMKLGRAPTTEMIFIFDDNGINGYKNRLFLLTAT
jgi:hypothetical protein